MVELPSGTVTLLFTDIEGSTRLLQELGTERYAEALAEHRRLTWADAVESVRAGRNEAARASSEMRQ